MHALRLCLPTCPTYDATKLERHSPRGRISLMRAIADRPARHHQDVRRRDVFLPRLPRLRDRLPGGVNYAELFEHARAEVEERRLLEFALRRLIRWFTVKWLFMDLRRLLLVGRAMRCTSGLAFRRSFGAAA